MINKAIPLTLALIVLFSFAWLAASVFDVLEARQFMILSMIQGVLFCVLGSNIYVRRYDRRYSKIDGRCFTSAAVGIGDIEFMIANE